MSLDERFDKIIKNKVNEAEFTFDESNWQKASALIDAERGVSGMSKNSKLFLLFGSLFFVVATITFFSLTFGNSDKNLVVNKENKTVLSSEINQTNHASLSTEIAAESKVEKPINATTDDKTSTLENKTESLKANEEAVNFTSEKSIVVNKKATNKSKSASDLPKPSDKEITLAVNHGNTNNPIIGNLPEASEGKPENNIVEKNANTENKKAFETNKIVSHKPISSIKNSIIEPLGNKKSKASNASKKQNHSISNAVSESEKLLDNNHSESIISEQNVSSETYNHLEMRSSILQIWTKDEALINTPYDFIRIYKDDDYYKKSKRKLHFLNIEAGTTYLFGWESDKGRDGKGFNVFGGLNYGLYVSRKASVSVGLQAYNVSNIKESFYKKSSLTYDFGQNGKYTNITTNSLFYFSVPVKVYYNVSSKGKVGLGVNAGFLFNGKNTIENYSLSDNVKSNVVITNNTGYYQGLSRTNILVSALYNHSINRRIKLNTEVLFGLSDTYNNTVSKTAINEKNIGLRLSLQYILFDK